jgi:hypothetical protein
MPKPGSPKVLVVQDDDRTTNAAARFNRNSSSGVMDYAAGYNANLFPPQWRKVFQVKHYMYHGTADYILWLDARAVVVGRDHVFELVRNLPNCSMWISADSSRAPFGTGGFIVRNDVSGLNLFEEWAKLFNSSNWRVSENRWMTNGPVATDLDERDSFAKHLLQKSSVCKLPYFVFNEVSCDKPNGESVSVLLAEKTGREREKCMGFIRSRFAVSSKGQATSG